MNSYPSELLIPVIYFNANKIKSSALNMGLLAYQNEQFHDVPGSATPYEAFDLFAVSPVRRTVYGGKVNFKLQADLYITNTTKSISLAEIDPDDGIGYRAISFNTPLSITYNTFGEKVIKIAFTFSDGKKLYSQFKVVVDAQIQKSPSDWSDLEQPFSPVEGQHSGGIVYVKYANSNTAKKLKRPLIVAEGFDPSCLLTTVNNSSIDAFLQKLSVVYLENGQNFYSALLSNYDIVYLDYKNGVDDIFRNARLLEDAIAWVNRQKAGVTDAEPNVVMGISMGGLVSKIALRRMEVEGGNHNTRLFISFDSPHKGANVPPAYQALVWHLNNLLFGVYVNKEAYMLAKSTATKQLLKLYVDYANGTLTDSYNKSFITNYENYSFPINCRNIAVVNGSNNGNTLFIPYTKLLGINSKMGDISFKINAYSLPNKKESTVYDGLISYCKKVGGTVICVDFTKQFKSSIATLPYDGAPGGFYDISFFGQLPSLISNYVLQQRFNFVPIASALSISSTNPLEVLGNQDLIGTGKTPFASYFAQSTNEPHTWFTPQNAKYIINELASITCLPVNNTSIIGEPFVCSSGSAFIINNLPSGYSVSWTSSNNLSPSSAFGNPVTFTAKGSGAGWIQATTSSGCGNVTLPQQTVWVGLPLRPYISNGNITSTYSTVDYNLTLGQTTTSLQLFFIDQPNSAISNQWSVEKTSYPSNFNLVQTYNSVIVTPNYIGTGSFTVKGINQCGESDITRVNLTIRQSGGHGPIDPPELPLDFAISPNPATDQVSITLQGNELRSASKGNSSSSKFEVQLWNATELIKLVKTEEGSVQLPLGGLASGTYYIRVIHNEKVKSKVFFKR